MEASTKVRSWVGGIVDVDVDIELLLTLSDDDDGGEVNAPVLGSSEYTSPVAPPAEYA